MEGQYMFPKPLNNRYCPYFFSRCGLRENNFIFDGLYNGVCL